MKILLGLMILFCFQMCVTRPQGVVKTCFSGKLVKRGICGQRVIQVLSDAKKGLEYARTWTDSLSGRQYTNVFTVSNACDFPASVKDGDTLSFALTAVPPSICVTCYAYTPVPVEKNRIVVGCPQ
ncbi:MAG: hypothetical protein JWQ78_1791 [Sediminibacterium sp.]|nr:hypothetical protein [Sediminibacterium sp.]